MLFIPRMMLIRHVISLIELVGKSASIARDE